MNINQTLGPSPSPLEPVGLSTADIQSAIEQGQPFGCDVNTPGDMHAIHALVKGPEVRLTNVRINDEYSNGTVIYDGSVVYAWEDGWVTGWKVPIEKPEDLSSFLQSAQSFGIFIPDVRSSDSIRNLSQQGYAVDCETAQVTQDSFIPPQQVDFTDITAAVRTKLQLQH